MKGEHSRGTSSFGTDPLSFQAIKVAEAIGAKKILDVGCGAGFFRYALEEYSNIKVERYHGVDISTRQIARAKQRFNDEFRVASADKLDSTFISEFDFVHIYSVLNFMHPGNQMKFLSALLNSRDTNTMLRFAATEKNIAFCPQVSYKNLGRATRREKTLLSQIGFCLLSDIKKLVAGTGRYELDVTAIDFAIAPACNLSSHDGAIAIDADILAKNRAAEKEAFGIGTLLKAHQCTIRPKGIDVSDVSIPAELVALREEGAAKTA